MIEIRSTTTRALLVCAVATTALLAACGDDAAAPAAEPASSAPATPALSVDELAEGKQKGAVEVDVPGAAQVNFRKITIPPGAGTGRHCHHGQLIGVVEQGTLTHYAPVYDGGVHEYVAGDSIVEGSGYVHEGRNEGDEDVVLWVTYVTPSGDPLAETDLSECDAS